MWEWPRSTPEEQGLSSTTLAEMVKVIRQQKRPIHSILVIRHGVMVLEAYAFPFAADIRHCVYSTTKSITSALVGIAVGDELLGPVDMPVSGYFPSAPLEDPRKNEILVEHLLSMDSGIEWMEPLHSGLNDLWGIIEADDPVQYFFNPALVEEPGTVYNYNSGGSHLLSILVQEASGKKAVDFAAERLFHPLGIRDYAWQEDFTGHSVGGTGLELRAEDMAKIGQLYLDGGQWQGEQIIPADWVVESTRIHSDPPTDVGYGYQWWIRPEGDYYSLGWGGQQIRVFPEQDMVVVFTAGAQGDAILHEDLVDTYLFPAVISDEPLPADDNAHAALVNAITAFTSPQVWPSQPSSKMVDEIDGKQWLVTGMGEWSIFGLHFPSSSEGVLDLEMDEDMMHLRIGLDGTYRVTSTDELGLVALAGYWESSDSFVVVQQNVREADLRMTHIRFNGNTAKLYSVWSVEKYEEETEAVLFGE